jgi:hypothetical protein
MFLVFDIALHDMRVHVRAAVAAAAANVLLLLLLLLHTFPCACFHTFCRLESASAHWFCLSVLLCQCLFLSKPRPSVLLPSIVCGSRC